MNWIKRKRAEKWDRWENLNGIQFTDGTRDEPDEHWKLERAMYIKYGQDCIIHYDLPDWFIENKTYQDRLLKGWYRYKKPNGKKTLRGWIYWKLMYLLCGDNPEFYKVSTSSDPKYKGTLACCNPIYHLLDKIKMLEQRLGKLEEPKPISISVPADFNCTVSK